MKLELPEYARDLFVPKRYKVFFGGRGGGKSWAFAIVLLTIGMSRRIRVLCARELQVSISDSVHKLLSDLIESDPAMRSFYKVQNNNIFGLNGTEFAFKGLKHNANEIKSYEGVDYVWVEEAQSVSDRSWETLIPTIRKAGSEIWISFNPKNANDPTYRRFITEANPERMIVRKVSWRDNPFFPDVLDEERRQLLETDQAAYAHIWEGELDTRYSGEVYAKWVAQLQAAGRVNERVKHDPAYPVYTAWDLGYDDATAIWFFQIGGGELFVIDYMEDNLEDIKYYVEALYGREIVVDRRTLETGEVERWHFGEDIPEFAHRKEYSYHAHYVPHDAANKMQAAGGRSIIAQAQMLGVMMTAFKSASQQNQIEALRNTLPKCWINSERCKDGIHALMSYHFEYDEDKKAFKKIPYHDWSSHGADSAEIMAFAWREQAITKKEIDTKKFWAKFNKAREIAGLAGGDPYRMRSKR